MASVARLASLTCAAAVAASAVAEELPRRTALDDYVEAEDDSYAWRIASQREGEDGSRTIVVDLVSQHWLTPAEVDRPQWQHWLTLSIPPGVPTDGIPSTAMLYIGGGRNGGDAPMDANARMAAIAEATGTVVAELSAVPNQPLVFHDDGRPRTEDDLIGYAWDQYIRTGDPRWAPRNAMVKSAVRAMDAVTEVMGSEAGGGHTVDRFVVAGGSKRGWTTWLTGALDSRVIAVIPIVIDVVNVAPSMAHHFAAYGFWTPAIGNYVDHGIVQRFGHPRLSELYRLVDPYFYRHRLTMPKLVLNAAGDQFFAPDSWRFYWRDLRGENYLRYVPNGDHGLDGTDAVETIVAFHTLIAKGVKPPQFAWSRTDDGGLAVLAETPPEEVKLWQAHNPEARDFRVETLGRAYTSTVLESTAKGLYVAEPPTPARGWTAWFIELTFAVEAAAPLKLTTGVMVTPDTLPFADKAADQPTSVTVACRATDVANVPAIQAAVASLAEAAGRAGAINATVQRDRLFFNWPPGADFASEARQVAAALEELDCGEIAYQLESGPGATLPPGLADAVD